MKSTTRNKPLLALSIGLAICFAIVTYFVMSMQITGFDEAVTSTVWSFRSEGVTPLMKVLSFIGNPTTVVVIAALTAIFLFFVLKHRAEMILFFAVMIFVPLTNTILKRIFTRARPDVDRLLEASGHSFPSGHSMIAVAFFGVITFLLWRHISSFIGRIVLIIFSTLMILGIGISRIYVGVHYPSDVLGGFLISSSILFICIWFWRRNKHNRSY
ncbi:phosphatase PAP2 family protein [Paenibacillus sp. N1-5-1-14]|uniref:phosphatase PAP2 family protein n=1 Tax=Paenibacillus radicibacter TaxID=2972488 RepID=UPI002159034C|nr:phosphatase PAP2 family protein [Paenibacillus radicibacter]MCR8641688.1 phosphatase PAP2 family protein [Paenibacillus radicibacter]